MHNVNNPQETKNNTNFSKPQTTMKYSCIFIQDNEGIFIN